MNHHTRLGFYFHYIKASFVLFIFLAEAVRMISYGKEVFQKGRIKAFDDVLRMYGKQINTASDLNFAIDEIKRLAKSPEFFPEFANYYIEILELLAETKDVAIIQQETNRLNTIIASASSQHGGQVEMDYAIIRRNILSAFYDSAAAYVIYGEFESQTPSDVIAKADDQFKKDRDGKIKPLVKDKKKKVKTAHAPRQMNEEM